MRSFLHDLRFACRLLAKSPGFTISTVLTLALAIGVNSAMFSLVNEIILAPLPFADSDRLVRVFRDLPDGDVLEPFSYPDYREYRDRSDAFEDLVAYSFMPTTVERAEGTESLFGQIVTGNYFKALGVPALHGRTLTPEDDLTPGGHPVAVISHRYWHRALGGDPTAVGSTINLSGHPFTIVGIMPQGFAGAMPVPTPELWMPMLMLEQIRPEMSGNLENRASGFLWVMGRLNPGVSMEQAQAGLDVMYAQLKEVDAERYEAEAALLMPSNGIIPMTPPMRRIALAITTLVMAMVGLVLLVGCANVANLLLARATVRRKEIGIRIALGAPGSRILRQLLTESVLLSLLGGIVGLFLAMLVMNLVASSLPRLPFNIALDLDFSLDHRILIFTGVVSMLAGVAFGLFPALGAARVDPVTSIKEDGGSGRFEFKRSRLRSSLVVAQVASSLVLLIVAGLFIRSLMQSNALDPGFDHDKVLCVMFDIGASDYDENQSTEFCERLLEGVRALPGVESASIEGSPPLSMVMSSNSFWIEGRPYESEEDERIGVGMSRVSDENFRTLGITLLRGRDFNEMDTSEAPAVVVINLAFADRYWPGQDAIGKRLSRTGEEGPFMEVVGVVSTIKYWLPGEEPRPYLYLPITQNPENSLTTLLMRTNGDPKALIAPARSTFAKIDPNIALSNTSSLTELIGFILLPAKFAAFGFGMFGLLALLLASVGLYAVMSFTVSQRTREIGVRIALGAPGAHVLRNIIWQGLKLTVIGLVVGLILAWAGTRVLGNLLYNTSTVDPVTFVGISLLLGIIALLACYFPARRATRIDPMRALRYE